VFSKKVEGEGVFRGALMEILDPRSKDDKKKAQVLDKL
jgi:hypothetical protein